MEQHQRTFSLWYFLAAIVAMLVIEGLMSAPRAETLPYSDFKALVRADSGDLTSAFMES